MPVHPQETEAIKLPEGSILTSCRVADGEFPVVEGDDDEAIARGLPIPADDVLAAKSRDGLELVGGGEPCPVVEGNDAYGLAGLVEEEGQRGLAAVVGEEEAAGGGGAADGTAAEEAFGGQADEDLPDRDLVWEATVETRRSCCCGVLLHGRCRELALVLDLSREQE